LHLKLRRCFLPAQAALLLALNFLPLAEGRNWVVCRTRARCLTLLKLLAFALLCWEAGRCPPGSSGSGTEWARGAAPTFVGGLRNRLGQACGGDESEASALLAAGRWQQRQPGDGNAPADRGTCPSLAAQLALPPDKCWGGGNGAEEGSGAAAPRKDATGVGATLVAEVGQVCLLLCLYVSKPNDTVSQSNYVEMSTCLWPPERYSRQLSPPLPNAQSKLFALAHAGFSFRYARWQHTAALQALLLGAAAAQAAAQDVCGRGELAAAAAAPRAVMQQLAQLLCTAHWLPLGLPVSLAGGGEGSAAGGEGGEGGGERGSGVSLALSMPPQLDACRLLLTWLQVSSGSRPAAGPSCALGPPYAARQQPSCACSATLPSRSQARRRLLPGPQQVCFGWALPVWVAFLSEEQARARFAEQHAGHLLPDEKEWAAAAAVG
jgi:hypothetical protein